MEFGSRLKEARKRKGLTLKELGQAIDRSDSVVQRYESGVISNLDNEVVSKLADAVDVSPAYLMGWTDINTVKSISIPVLGKIACGDPITAEENVQEYRERPVNNLPQGEIFYLQADGDSMEPVIPNGSYILVRQQEEVENGEIAAVLVNDDEEVTLKKYRKLNDVILLEALNDEYDPYIVNEDNPARILGKAIEVSFEL